MAKRKDHKKPLQAEGVEAAGSDARLFSLPWTPLRYLMDDPSHQGHLPFIPFLLHILRPRRVVVLGMAHNDGYFAFCQAVQEMDLATRCMAVDPWTEDRARGQCGEGHYREAVLYNQLYYAAFSQLWRAPLDEAADNVEDGSVDVLYIDDPAAGDAAWHHYWAAWRPKLSRHAVVLLPGIADPVEHIGVQRAWDIGRRLYPSLALTHAPGLGMLAVGEEQRAEIAALCAGTGEALRRFQHFFAYQGHPKRLAADRPDVSIIIPQYGHEELTRQCLRSLREHVVPFHAVEIVVVDDGSPNFNSAALQAELAGLAFTLVRNPENWGFAISCNRGAAAARGRTLVFLNNDTVSFSDWLTPM
ncbi:MAG: glycosyltransferase, partial [Firmicutes bacterium]|nr:glycosyltransferase [Bacillota bacterium]